AIATTAIYSSITIADTANTQAIHKSHGIAMHGEPKYPAGFKHFDYVNPAAPKGGSVKLAVNSSGGFDSLNPFVLKGVSAAGIGGYLYETLTQKSDDEAFTQYGLIAESIEWPEDRSWVIYHINPNARFHDGHAIDAEDVIYTFELLTTKAHPFYASYYKNVRKVEAIGDHSVKFSFEPGDNRELALIIGQLPVLPKHYWQTRDFSKTSLEPPLGSGPYKISKVDPGRSITYTRVKNYWGKDLNINAGLYNFDQIHFDYYRDNTIALEAFKAGEYDFRAENTSRNWATAYTGPAFDRGHIVKESIRHYNPTGMQGFVMNSRRWPFKDPKVRQALSYAFDFEWTNKQLFYSAYTRNNSYFTNSELASRGLPSKEELKLLEPFRDQLPPELFTTEYQPPKTDGSGRIRGNLRKATKLLKEAGWKIENKKLIETKTGKPFEFTILLVSADFQRVVLPFTKNLEKLGIKAEIRLMDTQQYISQLRSYDFDMVISTISQSSSPGNEQHSFWHSSTVDIPRGRNIAGVSNSVVDHLVDLVIAAPDRESLITRTRALDRVLLWNHYVIPHFHTQSFRVAYWNRFSKPAIAPRYALGFDNWWIDPAKQKALDQATGRSH
ncbi:MAG: extracellular solute-binding protein, partial [Pseudomonadales bacterium]|nr:extracellular solute-binding protein [Pseudomonadales bacterium]